MSKQYYKDLVDEMRAARHAAGELHAEVHKLQDQLIRIKEACGVCAGGGYKQPPLETVNIVCGALAKSQEHFEAMERYAERADSASAGVERDR